MPACRADLPCCSLFLLEVAASPETNNVLMISGINMKRLAGKAGIEIHLWAKKYSLGMDEQFPCINMGKNP